MKEALPMLRQFATVLSGQTAPVPIYPVSRDTRHCITSQALIGIVMINTWSMMRQFALGILMEHRLNRQEHTTAAPISSDRCLQVTLQHYVRMIVQCQMLHLPVRHRGTQGRDSLTKMIEPARLITATRGIWTSRHVDRGAFMLDGN
jgi:hypothetical protein